VNHHVPKSPNGIEGAVSFIVNGIRVLVLMHDYQVPPADVTGVDIATAPWKTEYDVLTAVRDELGHDVQVLGSRMTCLHSAGQRQFKPIAFNLLRLSTRRFDQNAVSYLELLRLLSGCNPRGMLLARDKALSKKLLHYHRVRVPEFVMVPRGRKPRLSKGLTYPVIVKSLTQEASIGISQASVVEDETKLRERVQFIHDSVSTDAIVEEYVNGRELYCGVIGNQRVQVLPVWEMTFSKMPEDQHRIATERVKWNPKYEEDGIKTGEAKELPEGVTDEIQHIPNAHKVLEPSGTPGSTSASTRKGVSTCSKRIPTRKSHGPRTAESAPRRLPIRRSFRDPRQVALGAGTAG
jgi:D-alanine-D-alanine ligase